MRVDTVKIDRHDFGHPVVLEASEGRTIQQVLGHRNHVNGAIVWLLTVAERTNDLRHRKVILVSDKEVDGVPWPVYISTTTGTETRHLFDLGGVPLRRGRALESFAYSGEL